MYTFKEHVGGKIQQLISDIITYVDRWLADASPHGIQESSSDFDSDGEFLGSGAAASAARRQFAARQESFCDFVGRYGPCEMPTRYEAGAYGWVGFLNDQHCVKFTFDEEEYTWAGILKGQSAIVPILDTHKEYDTGKDRDVYILAMKVLQTSGPSLRRAVRSMSMWLMRFFIQMDVPPYRDFFQQFKSKAQAFRWSVFVAFTKQFARPGDESVDENNETQKELFTLIARTAIRFNVVFLGDFRTSNIMQTPEGKPMHIDLQMPHDVKRVFWNS